MTDRDFGINYLRFWFNATPMHDLGFSTYQDAIAHYDAENPDFIAALGNVTKKVDQTKIKDAFVALATDYGTRYPKYTEFFNYAAKYAGSVSWSDVKDAGAESVSQIKNLALGGLALYLGIAAVGLVLFVMPRRK